MENVLEDGSVEVSQVENIVNEATFSGQVFFDCGIFVHNC